MLGVAWGSLFSSPQDSGAIRGPIREPKVADKAEWLA